MAGSKLLKLEELMYGPVQVSPELVSFLEIEKNRQQISLIHLRCQNELAECPFEITGKSQIRTTRWIGSISFSSGVHSETLVVEPRIGPLRVQFMLGIVINVLVLNATASVSSREGNFQGILALAWLRAYQLGLKRHGIPKEYCLRQEPHAVALQGRFDPLTNLRENIVQKHHIACEYYHLTYDNPINQSVIEVINFLRKKEIWPFSCRSNKASDLINDRDKLIMMGVALNSPRVALHRVKWGRHNDAYFPVLKLAQVILEDGQGTGQPSGIRINQSYFLDMAEIWELFLFSRLKELSQQEKFGKDLLEIQHPRLDMVNTHLMKYENKPIRKLIPDFCILNGSEPKEVIGIIDAKYKILKNKQWGAGIPSGADTTQMALYQSHYATTTNSSVPGALLYPRCENLNYGIKLKERNNYSEANLEVKGKPSLSWWFVDLPADKDSRKFVETVDLRLTEILEWFLRFRSGEKPLADKTADLFVSQW